MWGLAGLHTAASVQVPHTSALISLSPTEPQLAPHCAVLPAEVQGPWPGGGRVRKIFVSQGTI